MKRIILSMLALGAMTSCANQEDAEAPATLNRTPINLDGGVMSVTRAPITSTTKFDFAIAGWEAETGAVNYTQGTEWATTASLAAAGTSSPITWTKAQYYAADNTDITYMQAWYPAGTLTAGAVTFPNTDGTVDAILATPISGSKNTPATALVFAHKTTQFVFKVAADASFESDAKLTSITIKNVKKPIGFALSATPTVTYEATAVSLLVPGIVTPVIGTTAASVGQAVMVEPITGGKITLDIVTDKGSFNGVEVTVPGAVNTAYTITLTFKQKGVELTAKVTDWVPGTAGADVL